MSKKFAVVIQTTRFNSISGRSTLYVLGVRLFSTRDRAVAIAKEEEGKMLTVDLFEVDDIEN